MLVSIALAQLLQRCAPSVGARTMSAVIAYESGGRENAIGDNTAHRSYFPADRARAQTLATHLLGARHDIDVGLAQINSGNFPAYRLTVASAFDPCVNVATGARILGVAYAGATRKYGPGQVALVHALSAYNTGGYWAGLGYAHGVYAAARSLRYEFGEFGQRAFPFKRAAPAAFARTLATKAP